MALDEDAVLALEPALRHIANTLASNLGVVVADIGTAPSRVWSTDGVDADGFVQHREHRIVEPSGEVVVAVDLAWWNPRELASATLKAFVKSSDGRGAHVFLEPPRAASERAVAARVIRHGGLEPAVVDAAILAWLPGCTITHR